MTITKTEIANMALAHVGNKQIADFDTDTSFPAQQVRLFYPVALGEMLEAQEWSFATKRGDLSTPLVDAPLFGFDVAFQLPNDCVLVVETDPEEAEWRIEGNTLVTNESSIGIVYVYNFANTAQYNSRFVSALTFMLGAYLAMPITRDKGLADNLFAKANVKLAMAQSSDSQQGSRRIEPMDTLIAVRR